jgi:hypothetical protein
MQPWFIGRTQAGLSVTTEGGWAIRNQPTQRASLSVGASPAGCTGRAADGRWIVKLGNDGHRVRERLRSIAGAVALSCQHDLARRQPPDEEP